ncbi:MAG: winged helix-turn-helix domain-containing protein [Methylobacter sp.]|nr:winged helix-turn-helix domain-containing protein [Methylobacter sp.]MDP2098309.1 winged helix-turn-helix domain-containing protein [Methylobacter sp.]MDP2429117.1 winged helix-turn-helix domain-containing protein [Methylobacter sp.]MDP3055592.1 winged helix-turn-helix domain-containing protein [Methylobacter sp.]MDP3364309.1 winged helix-turn-helix domain-containing protein [Methylobacter sp.]
MNTDFRIVLMSEDPYHLGLLKGYCHAQGYQMLEAASDGRSFNSMMQMQPNLVIVVESQFAKTNFEWVHNISVNHQIPVCYLRDNNTSDLDKALTCRFDAILNTPLDVSQLEAYLCDRFKHHQHFLPDYRNRARRAVNDRRLLSLKQKNGASGHQPDINTIDGNPIAPFQIDHRSKCVLFNGEALHLTRKEFELFELLANDPDRVFLTDEIISYLWPKNNRATKSDLYQYMHLLRKKIESNANSPQWLLTVKGFGYKLNMADINRLN